MRIVAPHLHQMAAIFAAELNLDATVAFAQNARGRFPLQVTAARNGEIS